MAPVQSVILLDGELDLDGNKKYLVVIRVPHFFHIKGVGGLGTSVDAQQLKKRKLDFSITQSSRRQFELLIKSS